MTARQRDAVNGLKDVSLQETPTFHPLSLAQRALKKRKISGVSVRKRYKETRFIVQTSNAVESLF